MKNLALSLKKWRTESNKTMLELSAKTGIDQALLSKYETGKRVPSEKHLVQLSEAMHIDFSEIKKELLADKIAKLVQYEQNYAEILMVAESRVEYLTSNQALILPELPTGYTEKLDKLDKLKNQLKALKPLQGSALYKLKEYFRIQYTYDSNQIEGNTLTLKETHLVINEGITVGGKSMREHLEAINHAEAVDFIEDLVSGKEKFNRRSLLEVHRLVLKSIDNENAGRFRNVPVRISGSQHVPPQPYLLEKMMEEYFMHYEIQKKRMHPVLLAAEMHERLVSIHPFIDGNGRTSRLIMNFILLQNGYTITSLKGDLTSRKRYYDALEAVQVDNDTTPFYDLIIEKAEESLKEHIELSSPV
ncbi:MAG: Fic family protein [Flavobacteriales bacterium]|nr:Fic family protein [Flavobacteriales bacterium]